jgi:hypothetical protein
MIYGKVVRGCVLVSVDGVLYPIREYIMTTERLAQ